MRGDDIQYKLSDAKKSSSDKKLLDLFYKENTQNTYLEIRKRNKFLSKLFIMNLTFQGMCAMICFDYYKTNLF